MYDYVFCRIYDELGWNYYPESFAESLLNWIQNHHISINTHLDYGCGTGVLCNILQQHKIYSTGIDLSASMIDLARSKYPLLHFEVGDMTSYQPVRPVSLITSTCDALNHLPSMSLVEKAIQNAYRSLTSGGYFIFDLLKEEENQSCPLIELGTFQGNTIAYEVVRQPPNIIMLKTKIFFDDFLIDEKIVQEYFYDPQEILKILKNSGFTKVSLKDTFASHENGHGTTWYFIAQK